VNASFETARLAWPFSFAIAHDPEKCEAAFRKIMLKQEPRRDGDFQPNPDRAPGILAGLLSGPFVA
jgi:hypothetical protein